MTDSQQPEALSAEEKDLLSAYRRSLSPTRARKAKAWIALGSAIEGGAGTAVAASGTKLILISALTTTVAVGGAGAWLSSQNAESDIAKAENATTNSPTTNHPTTNHPTTNHPTTNSPTTNHPTTNSPTTNHPTTNSPTTNSPTTNSPTTNSPTTNHPTVENAPTDRIAATLAPRTAAASPDFVLQSPQDTPSRETPADTTAAVASAGTPSPALKRPDLSADAEGVPAKVGDAARLDAEVRSLDKIRDAFSAGRDMQVLSLVQAHRQAFDHVVFVEEIDAVEVMASCRRALAAASKHLAKFKSKYPTSPQIAALERACKPDTLPVQRPSPGPSPSESSSKRKALTE